MRQPLRELFASLFICFDDADSDPLVGQEISEVLRYGRSSDEDDRPDPEFWEMEDLMQPVHDFRLSN